VPLQAFCARRARSGGRRGCQTSLRGDLLEHDPEKWLPVFRKRSCSNKKIERDDDSKKSHPALGFRDAGV
jgi:hypothetical protein